MVATSSFSIRRLAITGLAAISTLSIGINGLAVRPDHLARSFEPRSHAFTKTEVDVLTGPAAQTTRNSTESKNSTEERIIPDFTPVPNKTDVINITKNWPIDNKKHRDAKDHANIEAFCRTMQPYMPLYYQTEHNNYTAHMNLMQGGFRDNETVNQFRDTRLSVSIMPFNHYDTHSIMSSWASFWGYLLTVINSSNNYPCKQTGQETKLQNCKDAIDDLWNAWLVPSQHPTGYKAHPVGCTLYEWEILH